MPEETDNESLCETCGSRIPAAAPDGLCPSCILRESQDRAAATEAPTIEEIAYAFPDLEILSVLGRGGMGAVYHARQPKLNREIALKVLLPEVAADPAFAERFNREARALAQLNHPNIVSLFEFGEQGGFYFLAMEFVDGVNLRQAMDAGRFTPQQALEVIPGICNALEAAHELGILHRDIKPENILLSREGEVKIVDFGIARLIDDHGSDFTLTEIGSVLGSRQYMAPEQVEQAHAIDHRADIYSLGVVFYEMLTGELPIGRFLPPSMKSQANETIDQIVLRTLEKELDRRFQSVSQVKTEVQSAGETLGASGASSGSVLARDRTPRITFWSAALCGFGGVIACILGPIAADSAHPLIWAGLVIGLICCTLGYTGCWLALAAIRRKSINARGKGWLQFFAVLVPLMLVGWIAALGPAVLFLHKIGKGCIYWAILLALIPTCLVVLFVRKLAGVQLGRVGRYWYGGIATVLSLLVLGFAFLKDGRWPYEDSMLSGKLHFSSHIETDKERDQFRNAIAGAFGEHEGRYKVWLDEPERAIWITVLIPERSLQKAQKHIDAYAMRVLDLLPASRVGDAVLYPDPRARRSSSDPYDILGALVLVALVSSVAGGFFGLLDGRATGISVLSLLLLAGALSLVPKSSRSIEGVPYADGPPLPAFELPDFQPDFSSAELAATTLMEATIRKDVEILWRAFSKEWNDEDFKDRSEKLMNSFDGNVRVLSVKRGKTSLLDTIPVTVEIIKRNGKGTGRYGTAYALEDGEWRVAVPK